MYLIAVLASFVAFWGLSQAADEADRVMSLPGLREPINFHHYSGYLAASKDKQLHYWFVYSQRSPTSDPVILWLNGGPGCSSMEGMLNENGPFRVQPDGSTIKLNPYSWNKKANVLYIESPAGVGFSYSKDKNYTTDDDLVATDNLLALMSFFKKFPEFIPNDFYISGESYGGIYIPTLSVLVSSSSVLRFKGFLVGNGLSNSNMNDNSILLFAYYHGIIGQSQWQQTVKACCSDGKEIGCDFVGNKDMTCREMVSSAVRTIYQSDLNEYNMYADCFIPTGLLTDHYHGNTLMHSDFGYMFKGVNIVEKHRKMIRSHPIQNLKVVPPCANISGLLNYLKNPQVRKTLHIPEFVPAFDICSAEVGNNYKTLYNDMTEQYHKVLSQGHRILVYNGDVDMACNFLGDEWFVNQLGLKKVGTHHSWHYKNEMNMRQVGGFVQAFTNLTFVTIRGSGHMVPQDKPTQAYEMLNNFLNNVVFR